jgi:hypothetical protein
MAEELDKKQTVDLREVVISEIIQAEALVNLLEKKGIISKQELLEEIKMVQASMVRADK